MKLNHQLTAIFLLACFALCLRPSLAEQTDKHIVPFEFKSQAEAEKYVSGLFAGGSISKLTIGRREVLVIHVSGSGVPDIAFAAYVFSEGRWVLASEMLPNKMGQIIESHEITIVGNEIVVVGGKSGQKWVLFRANDKGR